MLFSVVNTFSPKKSCLLLILLCFTWLLRAQQNDSLIATTYTHSACGLNYVQASNALLMRAQGFGVPQPAPYVISGIPSCANIVKAFLYASVSGNGNPISATISNPAGASGVFPMTIAGIGMDKCWGYNGSYCYKADVTSIITGNGTYNLSGMPVSTMQQDDTDGATLFIIYSDPTQIYTGSIIIADGCDVGVSQDVTDTISGFTVCGPTSSTSCFMLVGDLQGIANSDVMLNSLTNNYVKTSATDQYYDCIIDPGAPAAAGQSTANFGLSNMSDCFSIIMAGMYYRTNCLNCTSVSGVTLNVSTTPGCTVGSATAAVSGGLSPYTYTWTGSSGAVSNGSVLSGANPGNYVVTVRDASGCGVATASLSLPLGIPQPSLSYNFPSCVSQSLQLNSFTSASSYSWSGPGGFTSTVQNPTIATTFPYHSGIYTLAITSGSCSAWGSVSVTINPLPVVTTTNGAACLGHSVSVSAFAPGGVTYTWTGPGGFSYSGTGANAGAVIPLLTPATIGLYNVAFTNSNTCVNSAKANVTIIPGPVATISATPRACLNSIINLQGFGGMFYSWEGPLLFASSAQNATFAAVNMSYNGIYTLTVTDATGCKGSTTTQIIIDPLPKADLTTTVVSHCVPFCEQFQMTENNASPITSVSWNIHNQTLSGNAFQYCFYTSGTHTITGRFTDQQGCSNTQEFAVDAYPLPQADFEHPEMKLEEGVQIPFINTSTGAKLEAWNWYFINNDGYKTDTKNAAYVFETAGTYPIAMVVKNTWGCVDTVVKTIKIESVFSLYVPNAFTPNGDGRNDMFRPEGSGVFNYHLRIYSRWGQQLFETAEFAKGWDGVFHGADCQNDVYTWRIYAEEENGKVHNLEGHVTLYR